MTSQTLLLTLIFLTNLPAFIKAQTVWCFNKGNHTRNSTYDTNLNTLLSLLPSNMDNFGFYNASLGQNQDRANAVALCRSDIQLDSCRTCIRNATVELVSLCPNYKQAILWNEFCTLRYSNETLSGRRESLPAVILFNVSKVVRPEEFNENLGRLVDDLRGQATSGGSLMKVAAGNRTTPNFQTIFALSQCTPDISPEDCNGCLIAAARMIPECCNNSRGVTILTPSCNLQYQMVPFYNITRIKEVQAMVCLHAPVPLPRIPTPPSPGNKSYPSCFQMVPFYNITRIQEVQAMVCLHAGVPLPRISRLPSPGNDDSHTTRTVIIIVVPIVLCLLLAACVGIFLRKWKKKLPGESNMESHGEISTVEYSLRYEILEPR